MKIFISVLLTILCCYAYGQSLPSSGFDKVRINEADKTVQADVKPVATKPAFKKDLFYAWYGANMIHFTQGGAGGKLLNGLYTAYYLNKNVMEQGTYKNGLKAGIWKSWKENGTLLEQHSWKKGRQLPDSTVPFWKKLPFLKKKHIIKDTVKK